MAWTHSDEADAARSEVTEQRIYELEALLGGLEAVDRHHPNAAPHCEIKAGLWSMVREQVKAVRAAHEAETATTAAE